MDLGSQVEFRLKYLLEPKQVPLGAREAQAGSLQPRQSSQEQRCCAQGVQQAGGRPEALHFKKFFSGARVVVLQITCVQRRKRRTWGSKGTFL